MKRALNDIYQSLLFHILPAKKNSDALHANGEQESLGQSLEREERRRDFALTTFTNELAAFLGSMHSEFIMNFSFLHHRKLPDLVTYLDQSAGSMAFIMNMALLLAFETSEE